MAGARYAKYLDEIEAALRQEPPAGSAQKHFEYIGGRQSKLKYLGLKVPQIDRALKPGFSFYVHDADEVTKILDYVWQKSPCYETMCVALAYFSHRKRTDLLVDAWPRLKGWVKRVDNWAHSDELSGIYSRTLEQDRKLVLPQLEEWSESPHSWARRQSIVSLLYYSAARKVFLPFPKLAAMVSRQIDFDEYYVQKGVGWTLREMGNVYPEKTLEFLDQNIERLSAAAFSAATEKLAKADKERLKARRRKNRGAP